MDISEETLNALRTVAPPSAAVYRLCGDVVAAEYLSPDLYALAEMSEDEFRAVMADDALHLVLPEDLPRVRADIASCLRSRQTTDCYFRIRHQTRGLD